MNRYILLHRIKWPVMIVVVGVTLLLDQWDILSFDKSWPLYLIAFGLLQLAERAAWSQTQYPDGPGGYPGPYAGPYTGQPGNWGAPPAQTAPPQSTSLSITPQDAPHDEERK
jgi:hypothetical protein